LAADFQVGAQVAAVRVDIDILDPRKHGFSRSDLVEGEPRKGRRAE
jgi:hypothetical protein